MDDERATIAVLGGEGRAEVRGRLSIGRECPGVEPERRLILDDPTVSRSHLEVIVDSEGAATVIDTSSNGTLLNGMRLERSVPAPLSDGDVLSLGSTELEFRTPFKPERKRVSSTTVLTPGRMRMVLVAGDLIGSTSLAEHTSSDTVATVMGQLFRELGDRLALHRGTLSHLAGDAMLAVWDVGRDEQGADRAVSFAMEAAALIDERAPALPVRHADGSLLKMGWGVSLGEVALSHLARGRSTVLGDPANVAFRLADAAARDGRAPVLLTAEVASLVRRPLELGPSSPLAVKGRTTPVDVRAILA